MYLSYLFYIITKKASVQQSAWQHDGWSREVVRNANFVWRLLMICIRYITGTLGRYNNRVVYLDNVVYLKNYFAVLLLYVIFFTGFRSLFYDYYNAVVTCPLWNYKTNSIQTNKRIFCCNYVFYFYVAL